MDKKVRVINKTGKAIDTEIYIGNKLLSLNKLISVSFNINGEDNSTVILELVADHIDVTAKNLKVEEA